MLRTKRWAVWVFLGCLSLALAKAVEVDTDGDGVSDTEETAFGTDPANSQSVPLRSLASWRFTDGTLNGDEGQQPIAQNNVSVIANGFRGSGVQFPSGGTASLKYRATELSGKRNISPVRGSILFRIKPVWESGDNLGAAGVTVLQTTNFAVRFNATGTSLIFTNFGSGNSLSLDTPDINVFGTAWIYFLVTYSPDQVSLEVNTPATRVVSNWGLPPPANLLDANHFFSIGSAANGSTPVNAAMDEIVTFNGVGSLSRTPTRISVVPSNAPLGLNVVWESATNAITEIKRRIVGTTTWGNTKAALGTNYFDPDIVVGERYEYNLNTGISSFTPEGFALPDNFGRYVKGTIQGSAVHSRGKIILLVDETLTNAIETEFSGFIKNLIGDGWQILRKEVPRHIDDYSSNTSFRTNFFNMTNIIRPYIQSNYALFGPEIKYILAIGHVPIAYTGTAADDGHTSPFGGFLAHTGAWASDLYHGDIDGIWTDTLTSTSSGYDFNRNFPGDGKLDQNRVPANSLGEVKLEIPVARIDFARLPAFSDSESDLLKKYFRKNADYRTGKSTFSTAASAIEIILGSTHTTDLANELSSKAGVLPPVVVSDVFADPAKYLFAVQSGPGHFDRVNDARPEMHTAADFAAGLATTNCAFFFLRGSYFPDWNQTNDVLRAVLATTNGALIVAPLPPLNTAWRGDGMGVGFHLGNEAADSINSWTAGSSSQGMRSMEMHGDPTLRFPVIAPTPALTWTVTNGNVTLSWSPQTNKYFVYRSTNGLLGTFERLNTSPLTDTNYVDAGVPSGKLVYMVRSAALSTAGGGTFTNLSQGVFSGTITSADPQICCIDDQTIPEDSALGPTPFSIGDAANEGNVTVTASSSNTTLVPNANIDLDGAGENRTVEITPAPNRSGAALITILTRTSQSTNVKTFNLVVNSVNDRPAFTKGDDQSVAQGAPAQTVNGWATGISAGPSESGQLVSFIVTNDSPHLFSAQPAVASNGRLTFTADPDQRGLAVVSVQAKDNGGTANSGIDTSYPQIFTITVGLPLDTDSDGLPDDFEEHYGFDPDVAEENENADWDGDGMTDLQEFAAGTHPKNSGSVVRISSAGSLSPTFSVSFQSVAGRSYSVDRNDNFPADEWETLASPVPGTGDLVQQLDEDAGESNRRIYRVETTGLNGESLRTEYAGLCRFTCLGNSDTFISNPFFRPAAGFGAVTSVNGDLVTVRGTPNWTPNQFVYAAESQSNTYFMHIRSGAMSGDYYPIVANGAATLTVDLQGNTLSALQSGDAVAVVPYSTLGTIFRAGEGVHESQFVVNRPTQILFPNISLAGINLSASAIYYFYKGAWRQVGRPSSEVWNDQVIPPDFCFIVRHGIATDTIVTMEGTVFSGPFRVDVRRNVSGKQDNYLAVPRPLGFTLDQSGLIESGAFRSSPFTVNRVDELLVFDNTLVAKNKSVSAIYYYFNNGWRKLNRPSSENHGGDAIFQPGNAFIIRSSSGSTVVWNNDLSND